MMKTWLIASACVAAMTAGSALSDNHYGGKGKGAQGGDREARLERMREHLELSDEQVEQIREIHENGGGRKEAREVLTDEQRGKLDTARERHRQKRANHEADSS